jgi:hypothetical protein
LGSIEADALHDDRFGYVPVPVVDHAADWYNAFAQDHDVECLLRGVTHGFSYEFTDPDPGGPFYSVSNYVPAEHAQKVDAWVQSETAAACYMPVDQQHARGTAAIGVSCR